MGAGRMDVIDRRVLCELDMDSRQPISALARKLRMSAQRLDYRIKMLEKSGILMHYIAVIDYRKLGTYNYYVCNLRLFSMGVKEEEEVLRKLALNPKCTLLFKCEGRWDVMIGTVAQDIFEARETFAQLLAPFKGKIEEKAMVMHIGSYHYGRRYLAADARLGFDPLAQKGGRQGDFSVTGAKTKVAPHDELDLRILEIISTNARMPTVQIARALGTTPETVTHRLRKMEKSGIIRYYSTLLNPEKYNYHFYRIYAKTDRLSAEDEMGLQYRASQLPNIFRMVRLFGAYDFLVDLVVDTSDKLRVVPAALREQYRDSAMRFEPSNVNAIYKYSYFCTSMFKPAR